MSTYIIGDVHGCYNELITLLKKISFKPQSDRLIFVGDLINRGPKSLQVLRFVRDLGDSAQVVLGNHDLSLIACAVGFYSGRGTDFPAMLKAKDSKQLVDWLRFQPLLIYDEKLDIIVTHAGIPPRWSIKQAIKQARKAEKKLQGKPYRQYLKVAYQGGSDSWQDSFDKYDKFRYRVNGFTRLRYCDKKGEPDYKDKCPVGKQSAALQPWFESRKKWQNDKDTRLFFGHWAALGYYQSKSVFCLDSGCVWGGKLTALQVDKAQTRRFWVAAK